MHAFQYITGTGPDMDTAIRGEFTIHRRSTGDEELSGFKSAWEDVRDAFQTHTLP
jgi:hypothetical protein